MKEKARDLLALFMFLTYVLALFLPLLYIGQQSYAFANSVGNYSNSINYAEGSGSDFKDDSVIVTLAETEYKTYSIKDFKGIGCVEIEDLTQLTDGYTSEIDCRNSFNEMIKVEAKFYKRILKLSLNKSDKHNVINVINVLNKRENVLNAAPNYIYSVDSVPNDNLVTDLVPNDSFFAGEEMWGLKGENGIHAAQAWSISTGSDSVTVGIIDTGIQGNHPDLINRISNAGLHRDCTVSPIAIIPNSNLVDPRGHGTHVAGIIGAQGNNSIGISGVCWDIRLVSLRVFDDNGVGNAESLVRAVNFAASQNIPILNFSGHLEEFDINLKNALEAYTGVFVCAAGNGGGNDNDTTPIYPASYDLPNIISVGSIDSYGNISSFSNYGNNSVSLFAPGRNILSTYPQDFCTGVTLHTRWGDFFKCECVLTNAFSDDGLDEWVPIGPPHYADGYHYMSGTSMAAPYVTGVAALMLSVDSTLTPAEIKEAVMDGVDQSTVLRKKCVSGGSLNAFGALSPYLHQHSYVYEPYGGGQHIATCECGHTFKEYHKGLFLSNGLASGHTGTCNICGFSGKEAHAWTLQSEMYVCRVCKIKAQNVPIVTSLMSLNLQQTLNNSNLKNGETVILGNMVVLYDQGQYFLLVELNTEES